jgi:dienelactone hydrolase
MEEEDKPIVSIFFQGHLAPRYHGTKYAGPKGMDIKVGKEVRRVSIPTSKEMLPNLYPYNELNDISYEPTCNPLYWCFSCAHRSVSNKLGVEGNVEYPHNLWYRVSLGGSEDVAQCIIAIRSCIKDNPTKKIVLFGASRGASTVLVALTMLSNEEVDRIGLVVAEAPFSSLPSIIESMGFNLNIALTFLEWTTQVRRDQMSPLQAVQSESFPLNVPILFVTSLVDEAIPPEDTQLLIDAIIKKRGPDNLHHLELKYSNHSSMSTQNDKDKELYYTTLHDLYERYI